MVQLFFLICLALSLLQFTRCYYHSSTRIFPLQISSTLIQRSSAFRSSNFPLKASFIQDELRPYTMKLHPKELFQKKESNSDPNSHQSTKQDLLQFFVDSLKVYNTLEEGIRKVPTLQSLSTHGLERQQALQHDIQWMLETDKSLISPECGQAGIVYSNYLNELITTKPSIPKFVCNFYNFYFAHTAGGVVIGKNLSKRLLNEAPLEFYQWKDGNLPELKKNLCEKIDRIAEKWTEDEKKECLNECLTTFRFAGSLLKYVTVPPEFGG